jgi:hypothetical protein
MNINIICEKEEARFDKKEKRKKEEARYILLERNFLFFRSTSFSLYREEDRRQSGR